MAKETEGATPTFRECVSMRYKKDTIMNGFATLVVLLLPLIALGIVVLLYEFGPQGFEKLREYSSMFDTIFISIEMSVIMAIMYNMYKRLRTHSQRDRPWRKSLIVFANRMGADTTELCEIDRKICAREHFTLIPVIILLMVAMFIYCCYLFIVLAPLTFYTNTFSDAYNVDIGVGDLGLPAFYTDLSVGVVICLVQLVLIIVKVLSFPYKHERRQCQFTVELSKCLGEAGITIPPMIKIVKHHNILFHIFLMLITAGLYSIWLVASIFKSMNYHLLNQWTYEDELLRVVESDGHELFEHYMPDYYADSDMDKREYNRLAKRNMYQIRHYVKKANRMPTSLVIAELFIIVLCANYILKIIALDCEITHNYSVYEPLFSSLEDFFKNITTLQPKQIMDLVMIPVDLIMLSISISALLGIASRRTSSWRKVTRACITFVIPLWISFIGLTNVSGLTHIFDFNVYATTIVLIGVFALMLFSRNIKEFYSPLGDEIPGIGAWLKYIFVGNLEGKDKELVIVEDVPDN